MSSEIWRTKFLKTFKKLAPEEMLLKRAIKLEHSKLTTRASQKTSAETTAGYTTNYNTGIEIKREPIRAVRN